MSYITSGSSGGGGGSGTVTSIASATGITLTPDPITATGTVGLTIPVVVSSGGTGAIILTSHGVLIGNGTSAVTVTTAGTTGQVLTGVTGSAPTFQSPAASSISITGDSGGSLTGSSFTLSGGSSGLTFAGAGSTETLGGTLVVANGGTGRASSTAFAVICGGTTSTAAQQSIASVGTAGQVLTSNGAGALPTFQTAAGGGVTSISGDSGGALTGALTLTGGTTGLTFAGAGTTETLGGTLAIANGGTNATSFTQSNGIVTYNGTRLVNYAGPQISSGGIITNTSQPAFQVYNASNPTNVTGDGTVYKVAWDTANFDHGSNFNTGTYTFTAPTTGLYQFNLCVGASSLGAANTIGIIQLVTTAQTYTSGYSSWSTTGGAATNGVKIEFGSWLVPMTSGDTAYTNLAVYNGTKTASLYGALGNSSFSGYLVA